MTPFDYWWQALVQAATRRQWPLGERDSYREYYDDGDSPATALELEIAAKSPTRRPPVPREPGVGR